MSKKKKNTSQDIRQYRKDLAILKRKGLVSSKLDIRKAKPTKHYIKVIRENRDVIEGKSLVVRIWHGLGRVISNIFGGARVSRAKEVAAQNQLRSKGGKVIVPVTKNETVSYNKKTGRLRKTVKDPATGKRIKADLLPANAEYAELERQGYWFTLSFPHGLRRHWQSASEMIADMDAYKRTTEGQPIKWNWRKYVTISKKRPLSGDSDGDDE